VRGEFAIRDSKTGAARTLPIEPNFRALLELLRHDPAGKQHPPSAFVFGDAVGGRASFPTRAWEAAVLRAHGLQPKYTKTKGLTADCRAALAKIDLTFHDLRHEAGSRLLERGWPLHHIQAMLGHANLSQTSTYLNATRTGLQDSMRRFGGGSLHAVAPEAGSGVLDSSRKAAREEGQVRVQ
jgi:integrase